MRELLELPNRPSKPREIGVTMMIDSHLGIGSIKDLIELGGSLIDYVKLGWGTALVTENLKDKIKFYKENNIPVCLGGTFFELAFLKNKLNEFEEFVVENNIELLEISDGTIEIPRDVKLDLIAKFSKNFKVLSEYGSKDATKEIKAPSYWARHMKEELEAGAWKVIAEGRESGTAGMYRGNSELRTGLVDEIVESIDQSQILWEAPKKAHQVWFVKKYGTNVNLGNIAPKDIIALETLRLGLRGDTLLHFHG